MNNAFQNVWKKIKNPPPWVKVFSFIIALLSTTAAIVILNWGFHKSPLAFVAYSLFGLAALSLAYCILLAIPLFSGMRKHFTKWLEKRDFTRMLLHNYGYRTIVFAIFSFAMSIAFSVFNGYMGIGNRSVWYGALAAYYVALAFLRGGILTYHKGTISNAEENNGQNDVIKKAKIYRNSGIIFLILNVALSSAIAQMIFSNEHFTYVGYTIYAFAAYAFYKITMSIVNLVRARRHPDLTIRAIRNVNLADATVSILALQTALLSTFNEGNIDISLANTLTGSVVSAFSIGLGIYMIVSAIKKIKNYQKENKNHEQPI
ncbi:MAG: hypothetical protein IKD43_04560 [Clostridia bacterium]|nr:hypothetical protein [Clostridia bacterium]